MTEYDFTRCHCKACSFGHMDEPPQTEAVSKRPTPWAVICARHQTVYLTSHEYNRQMDNPSGLWECPICRQNARWSDHNYDQAGEIEQAMLEKEAG